MSLDWNDLAAGRADALDGSLVEIAGWIAPFAPAERHDYFLLVPEPFCCIGCLPADAGACLEVFACTPLATRSRPVRLVGRLRRLIDDPAGWRYQLRDARLAAGEAERDGGLSRRDLMMTASLVALAAATTAPLPWRRAAAAEPDAARQVIADTIAIDMHSHAGRIIRRGDRFAPVAEPMRRGGMAAICLAMVADSPTLHVMADRRIVATRNPQPGELVAWGRGAFGRLLALAESERLGIVTDAASLQAARGKGPAIIVAAEGADFLDGSLERLDEALHSYRLRHLQLTHYRVNELGDIQTAPAVHNGLTDFGAEVVRACNRLGIVVDVAHGTYELVKRAAAVTTKPLILSHTSLIAEPRALTRLILPDHARAIAATGGVIGIWPLSTAFHNQRAYVEGIARMVDTVGVDHVGIGTDMLGLTVPSVFDDYADLPDVAGGLLALGFNRDEAGKILGGNYARVFAASVG